MKKLKLSFQNLKGILFIIICLNSCSYNKKVCIKLDGFPDIPNSSIYIASKALRLPFNGGKHELCLDSIKDGEFSVAVTIPTNSDTLFSRDKFGKRVYKYMNTASATIVKRFYINQTQSLKYNIRPAKPIPLAFIKNYKIERDYLRSDVTALELNSNSKDAQLYELFDRLTTSYQNYLKYKILDSLYTNSSFQDKIYNDFIKKATELNKTYNYPAYKQKSKELIRNNLENPVSVLQLLKLSKEEFLSDNENQLLLNSFHGRALQSSYYQQALLKFALGNKDSILSVNSSFHPPIGVGPDNKKVNFSFTNHSFTLVEFWASWCIPCRIKNPEWNKLLAKHAQQKFQILGISLDGKIDQWRNAIKKDSLEGWIHISDLENGFNGTNALQYGIKYIPYNILIDANGRIITKNIEPATLDRFLQSH